MHGGGGKKPGGGGGSGGHSGVKKFFLFVLVAGECLPRDAVARFVDCSKMRSVHGCKLFCCH